MRILYVDCFSGIAGDMFLAALLDLLRPHGIGVDDLKKALQSLQLPPWDLHSKSIEKMGIWGHKVNIITSQGSEMSAPHLVEPLPHIDIKQPPGSLILSDDTHTHTHDHDHTEHTHDHSDTNHTDYTHGYTYAYIKNLIQHSQLDPPVIQRSLDVFECLALAESVVHHVPITEVHFHEVGMVDSVVDIVGSVWCLDQLKIEKVISASPPIGRGWIRCAHGTMPLPAPATAHILQNVPITSTQLTKELVTPTGAALLKTLTHTFHQDIPSGILQHIAWGAGHINLPDRPNLLRLMVIQQKDNSLAPSSFKHHHLDQTAHTSASNISQQMSNEKFIESNHQVSTYQDFCMYLQCNIDDCSAERLSYLTQVLLQKGALDVWQSSIHMKKGRSATTLHVLCKAMDQKFLSDIIFHESSTLGIRYTLWQRSTLHRSYHVIQTTYGHARIKIAWDRSMNAFTDDIKNNSVNKLVEDLSRYVLNITPEYDDIALLATEQQTPFETIYQLFIQQTQLQIENQTLAF
jgi:pyridinium-3,5-bisthiocarboxylic acid mononucleotide nickel chelatase